ncbi:hypothetical protein [Niabella soli]|uniref:Uncharacterized protein n=1 Tax=Niabella soli DSM 19437 TaxID=929713 RepID=W0F7K5_9BACT|nr:hypothetical protein [Niabella soli]AHF17788.1 hypothetical protein NIASO_14245 [Niabella soli DSM 19437]
MRNQSKKNTKTTDRFYRTILLLLCGLWFVSGILIFALFSPRYEKAGYKHLSLDRMLLSFSDVKQNNKVTLINLQLKEASLLNNNGDINQQAVADQRKKIYRRLLEEKTKIPEPAGHTGFMIKQVPQ